MAPGSKLRTPRRRGKSLKTITNFPCDECGYLFHKLSMLNRHVLTVHEKGSYVFQCPIDNCTKEMARRDNLMDHMRRVHKVEPDKNQLTAVPSEKKKEEMDRQLECWMEGCGGVFGSWANLSWHLRKVHELTEEEIGGKKRGLESATVKLKCEVEGCSAVLSGKRNLVRHLRNVHGRLEVMPRDVKGKRVIEGTGGKGKRFKCQVEGCGGDFGNQNHLTRHVKKVHDQKEEEEMEEYPVLCFLCCFSFNSKQDHEKILEGSEEWREFVEGFGGDVGVFKEVDEQVSVCPDCLKQAKLVVDRRREMEESERKLKHLEMQVKAERRNLEEKRKGYEVEVGRMEEVVGGGDVGCLEARLEQGGGRRKGKRSEVIRRLRRGIVEGARKLEENGGESEEKSEPVVVRVQILQNKAAKLRREKI